MAGSAIRNDRAFRAALTAANARLHKATRMSRSQLEKIRSSAVESRDSGA
jgi:hypothetical protein